MADDGGQTRGRLVQHSLILLIFLGCHFPSPLLLGLFGHRRVRFNSLTAWDSNSPPTILRCSPAHPRIHSGKVPYQHMVKPCILMAPCPQAPRHSPVAKR
ncbi:hypothetical protein BDV33DRAFT_180042 [Aspergillus novoparasiticus]|uniref:Uncharacterized protein n=1 Tax=Aspergillus novoparasiticus TaxID=986946 RepID=A0A5N6EEM9_9EURO|nr:hypothetical protein BDV33DRAFT_180042 [Aspergillus novoparasiticus]